MDKFEEIRDLGQGRYSFFIGVHQYTLTTPMERERFARVISKVQQLVDSFPAHLSQDQRLFLSLLTMVSKVDRLEIKIETLADKLNMARKQD